MNKLNLCALGLLMVASARQAMADELVFPYADLFRAISSVKCNAEVFGEQGEKYNPTHSPMRKIADIKYALDGNRIYFDYVQHNEKGDLTWSQLYTYDGQQSFDFYRSDNRNLNVYNGKVPCLTMDGNNVMFEPFAFLYGERYTRPGFMLSLGELSKPNEWVGLLKMAKYVGQETIADRPCTVVEVKGAEAADSSRGHFVVRAWLDTKNNLYPVRWQRIVDKGQVYQEYTVVELGYLDEQKRIPFPKVADFKTFDEQGQLMGTNRIVPSEILFNQRIDDRLFTIDPVLARRIWDASTDTFIQLSCEEK